ncbi:MAG: thermonuclease family protein [Deltaproteobacteria bacterium]|nr:thermonuclease family protein [Deltaproteobacteria bacterium]
MKKIFLIFLSLFFTTSLHAKDQELHSVSKVIEANVIELDSKEIVRLIGIHIPEGNTPDTPQSKWNQKSKTFVEKILKDRKVWIENPKSKQDEQGRTWVYLYFNAPLKEIQPLLDRSFIPFGTGGDFMLNRMLIEQGYGSVESPFSFKYRSTFSELESKARSKQIGMWEDLR